MTELVEVAALLVAVTVVRAVPVAEVWKLHARRFGGAAPVDSQ
ncbi:hypothetical protein [Salinibacter ruber]|uniref:Uncharacterized protein n=1 Tax=Salinibacter ruber TaxID=146919 RepID=A0A9X3A9P0_9BACT|nr:hypothetical protein [Salinibacter ruber]MCS4123133.1 hypothetical protein [Salinibacter ruber]